MRTLAPLAGILLFGLAAGTALAQQPQPQAQPRPQLPNAQRPSSADTDAVNRTIKPGDSSLGEQHGRPAGDALTQPADPGRTVQGEPMRPSAEKGDTAATSAKSGMSRDGAMPSGRSGAGGADPGQGGDQSYSVMPDRSQPAKRADDGANNPAPGTSGK
ncbi:MAG TPA: hypothetical protein VGE72_11505 [Azospirillum sp.]